MNQSILVFEFITGGGLAGAPLPPSLVREGALMRDALMRDALELGDCAPIAMHDARLPACHADSIPVAAGDFEVAFAQALDRADAAFIVAPESENLLAMLAARVEASGRTLLGCDSATCRIAASKSRTAEALAAAGIAVLPHCADPDALPYRVGPWAVKPDDGAGCDGLRRVADHRAAVDALRAAGPAFIAQPWLAGEARSMNLMCAGGRAALLSVNRQVLSEHDGRIALAALDVGAIPATLQHAALAGRIAAALPGLMGPVGVDFIETSDGPVVVEINPRMSTSASALRAIAGVNLIALTRAAVRDGSLPAAVRLQPQRIVLAETVPA